MGQYDKKWKARCPRCSETAVSSQYSCDNCGRGEMRAYVIANSAWTDVRFGCSVCNVAMGDPRCSCGTSLGGVAKVGLFGAHRK